MLTLVSRVAASCAAVMLVGAAPNATFRDCPDCPEMVRIPAGSFMMGSPDSEPGRFADDEGPQHRVTIPAFAVATTPVTRGEYAAFVAATHRADGDGCAAMNDAGEFKQRAELSWHNPGFEQTDAHPVVCVSWDEAQAYTAWLAQRTGKPYRLLTEAEYEYANRGGSPALYWWGAEPGNTHCTFANGFDLAAKRNHPDWPSMECDDHYPFTSPVRTFPANPFGLFDTTGNIHQWVEDCFVAGYVGAPTDGSAMLGGECKVRRLRGGSWLNGVRGLRAALRDRDPAQGRYTNLGFRVARAL